MTCAAGANAVSVAASNNGVGYSAPVDLQIAVTDFALSVTPDNAAVAAGQSSRHVVTIAPQLGAYNSAVTLELFERQPAAADDLRIRSADGGPRRERARRRR